MSNQISLRDVIQDDLPIFFEYQRDPDANYMAAFTARDPTDRNAFMSHWSEILRNDRITKRTVISGDQIVGNIMCFEFLEQPHVGYWIGKAYWGKGIATQALKAFLHIYTERPLYGRAAADNYASVRVLEKCGFVLIGKEKSYANARHTEIEEVILKLENHPDAYTPDSVT